MFFSEANVIKFFMEHPKLSSNVSSAGSRESCRRPEHSQSSLIKSGLTLLHFRQYKSAICLFQITKKMTQSARNTPILKVFPGFSFKTKEIVLLLELHLSHSPSFIQKEIRNFKENWRVTWRLERKRLIASMILV